LYCFGIFFSIGVSVQSNSEAAAIDISINSESRSSFKISIASDDRNSPSAAALRFCQYCSIERKVSCKRFPIFRTELFQNSLSYLLRYVLVPIGVFILPKPVIVLVVNFSVHSLSQKMICPVCPSCYERCGPLLLINSLPPVFYLISIGSHRSKSKSSLDFIQCRPSIIIKAGIRTAMEV